MKLYVMPPIAYVNSNLNDFKRDINIIIYRKNHYVLTDIVIDNFESSIKKYNDPIAFYTISIGARPQDIWGREGDLNLYAHIKCLIKSDSGWDEDTYHIIDRKYVQLCDTLVLYLANDKDFSIGVRYHMIRKVIDLLLVPITTDCRSEYESSFYSNEINGILNRFGYILRIVDKYS